MNDSTRTGLWWAGLTAEKILGLLFILATALEAWDLEAFAFQIRYYHIFEAPAALWASAIGSIAWETLLGVAMLVGLRLRGWTFAAVAATLAGFTGLILYAWYYHNIEDCGCFGSLLPMGPASTSAKNAGMLILTLLAWYGLRSGRERLAGTVRQHAYVKAIVTGASCLLVSLAGLFHVPFDRLAAYQQQHGEDGQTLVFRADYAGQTYDTSEGEYFLAFLSDTCEQCRAEIPLLNDMLYVPEFPTVLAFLLAQNESTLAEFRQDTEFPAIRMDALEWIQHIREAPPRFYLVRDGRELARWDDHLPSVDEILDVLDGVIPALSADD